MLTRKDIVWLEKLEKILKDLYSETTSNVSETVELTTFQIKQLAKQYDVEVKEWEKFYLEESA